MKERFLSELKKAAVILCCGIILYVLVVFTEMKLPCIFNKLTGLLCPGCGITRMIIAITRFDFVSAFGYNKAIFVTAPVIAFIFGHLEYEYIRYGTKTLKKPVRLLLLAEIVLLLLFGIVRNLI